MDACSRLNPCPSGIECLSDVDDNNAFECLCPVNHRYSNNKCEPIIGDIIYKLLDSHEEILKIDDLVPVSFYRVRQFQMDWCSLGDMALTQTYGANQQGVKTELASFLIRVGFLSRYPFP